VHTAVPQAQLTTASSRHNRTSRSTSCQGSKRRNGFLVCRGANTPTTSLQQLPGGQRTASPPTRLVLGVVAPCGGSQPTKQCRELFSWHRDLHVTPVLVFVAAPLSSALPHHAVVVLLSVLLWFCQCVAVADISGHAAPATLRCDDAQQHMVLCYMPCTTKRGMCSPSHTRPLLN
jgi:hypothetical protein